MITLNANLVTRALVVRPSTGVWHAEVWLATPTVLTGSVSLVMGGLTLTGTVRRGGAYQGSASYAIDGGAGGWRQTIPAKAYTHGVGVKLSKVLTDAARAVGETVVIDTDRSVGPAFVREATPAGRVLRELVTQWWIDSAGVTQIGTRATPVVRSGFDMISYRPEQGTAVVATETPEIFEPGCQLAIPGGPTIPCTTIRHIVEAGSIRTEMWPEDDYDQFTALARSATPKYDYLGFHEYRVTGQSEAVVDLQPTVTWLPQVSVAARPGIAGVTSQLTPGASVLVGFVGGEPTRPFIAFYSAESDAGFLPADTAMDAEDSITLGGAVGDGDAVARVGDSCGFLCYDNPANVLYFRATSIAPWVAILTAAVPGVPQLTDPGLPITILTGSSKVSST